MQVYSTLFWYNKLVANFHFYDFYFIILPTPSPFHLVSDPVLLAQDPIYLIHRLWLVQGVSRWLKSLWNFSHLAKEKGLCSLWFIEILAKSSLDPLHGRSSSENIKPTQGIYHQLVFKSLFHSVPKVSSPPGPSDS